MLMGGKLEFIEVKNVGDYISEGPLIEDNEYYKCVQSNSANYVCFYTFTNNQMLKITVDESRNMDPDGGFEFLMVNIKKLVSSLVSEEVYI